MGLPASVRTFVTSLYWGHGCCLSAGAGLHRGFVVGAGIRQGCPLSPLLFAVAVDPLLRLLQRQLPTATVRAYADDLAVALQNWKAAMPLLVRAFQDFASASGLHLNFSKVVLVPLGMSSPSTASQWIASAHPVWAQVQSQR